jgi:hypothetical protein
MKKSVAVQKHGTENMHRAANISDSVRIGTLKEERNENGDSKKMEKKREESRMKRRERQILRIRKENKVKKWLIRK